MSARLSQTRIPANTLGTFKLPDDLQFVVTRGEGAELITADGRTLVDFIMGSGPMVLGHAHPRVTAAIAAQAARGTTFYTLNDMAVRLADRIARLVPCAAAVKFAGDGTEATFYALRLARAFTGRNLVLKFDGGFHGHHDYALQKPGTAHAIADSAGIPAALSETVVIAPFNDLEATARVVAPIASRLAAIIVEPVQRAIEPRAGFLEGLRALADRTGALLVFDEVVTGFRIALGGAQAHYRVTPDLCSLGKIVGGGLPLAAVAGRADVLELTVSDRADDGRTVYFNGTLNGNAIAAAAGLATLDVIEEEDIPAKLERTGRALRERFEEIARRCAQPLRMIGPSAFCEPVFGEGAVVDNASYLATDRAAAKRFGLELLRRGLFVHPASKMYLSSAHTERHLDLAAAAAESALRA